MPEKKLLLIDANSFIHRAFHALPPFKTPEGKPVGAIYGLTNTLLRVLEDEKPDYVAAAFDTPKRTFRKEMFEEYKAHRPETPDELISQIKEAYVLFNKMGIKTVEKPGFEADDVLGTLAEKFSEAGKIKATILTGDLDALQMVKEGEISVLVPQKGVSQMTEYDEERVEERFGVKPGLLADYKGLVGDSSDNIPGVPGIGPKTAKGIISKYGSVENVFKKKKGSEITPGEEKVINNKDQALMSKKLAVIDRFVPLKVSLEDFSYSPGGRESLIEYLKSLGFKSLVNRLSPQKKPDTLL